MTRYALMLVLLSLPIVHSTEGPGVAQAAKDPVDDLVRQLGAFPAFLPGSGRSDGSVDPIEERKKDLYAQIMARGSDAIPALARGLANADVQIRRHAALFLSVAASGLATADRSKLDIQPCLPELITALHDSDARVRQLAAQAIGAIGPKAVAAVPALITLLEDPDEGSRNTACIGLTGIGPAAKEALPALQRALSDPSPYVRRFAQRAIGKIDVR